MLRASEGVQGALDESSVQLAAMYPRANEKREPTELIEDLTRIYRLVHYEKVHECQRLECTNRRISSNCE